MTGEQIRAAWVRAVESGNFNDPILRVVERFARLCESPRIASEPDVIYQYTMLACKAEPFGYKLYSSRAEFVLRHNQSNQPFAQCPNLNEIAKQIANIILIHNLKQGAKP